MDTDPAQKFVSIYLDQIKQFLVSYINQFVGKPGFFFDFIVFQQFVINLKLQDFVLGNKITSLKTYQFFFKFFF